jgi:sigma-E factor negative regulatory protein RseA
MKQSVSELIDDELPETDARRVIAAIETDQDLSQAWHDYHLIGDAMRGSRLASVDVRAAVSQRLAREATVVAPRAWTRPSRPQALGLGALAASLGLAVALAWQPHGAPARGARHQAVALASGAHPAAARNPDVYFLAHQELTADQGLVKANFHQGTKRR